MRECYQSRTVRACYVSRECECYELRTLHVSKSHRTLWRESLDPNACADESVTNKSSPRLFMSHELFLYEYFVTRWVTNACTDKIVTPYD